METTTENKLIDLRKFSDNLYFMIGNRRFAPGENTTITVSLIKPAIVGDEIDCEGWRMKVIEVLEEKPHSTMPGNTYQKLSVTNITIIKPKQ